VDDDALMPQIPGNGSNELKVTLLELSDSQAEGMTHSEESFYSCSLFH
jgi:hypothetical protein